MPNEPYFFSFAQFLAAPREGKLLAALRELPVRPLTPDEFAAQVKVDEAYGQLQRFKLDYLTDEPQRALSLGPRLRKYWDRYQRAVNEQVALWRALRTDQQRWLYDEAVKARVIVPPQTVVDPRGDLEKEEERERKKKEKEKMKTLGQEADRLIPEAQMQPPDLDQGAADLTAPAQLLVPDAVEDAALDYVENSVGRFYFKQHWALHRNPQALSEWLAEQGYEVETDLVLQELDRIARELPAYRQ